MKSIPNKIIPLLVSILGLFVGYVVANPLLFGLCQKSYTADKYIGCLDKSITAAGQPFLIFFLIALPIVIIAMFVAEIVFKKWVQFSIPFILIVLFFVLVIPDDPYQSFMSFGNTHKFLAEFFGIIFVIISLGIFVFKSWSLRKKEK